MSWIRFVEIVCDGCGITNGQGGSFVDEARRMARADAWYCSPSADLCPRCRPDK